MYTPAVEEVPAEVLEHGLKQQYSVDAKNLDKRVHAMEEIFEAPRSSLKYARVQAMRLHAKCVAAGRGDLAAKLLFMVNDPTYDEKRKARAEAIKQAKAKFADVMQRA